ncbi:hypothetical protein B0H13DRAFT_1904265 [Mycena leptocephala]|nr:hypothetical protein B0H13DRAFT_1904265 [Mycena leptocephala]
MSHRRNNHGLGGCDARISFNSNPLQVRKSDQTYSRGSEVEVYIFPIPISFDVTFPFIHLVFKYTTLQPNLLRFSAARDAEPDVTQSTSSTSSRWVRVHKTVAKYPTAQTRRGARKVDSEPPRARVLARMYDAGECNVPAMSTVVCMDCSGRWIVRRRQRAHVRCVDGQRDKGDSTRGDFEGGDGGMKAKHSARVQGSRKRRCHWGWREVSDKYIDGAMPREHTEHVCAALRREGDMSKAKATREDGTHEVYEHHWAGSGRSAPGWSAERSRTSRDSGGPVVMAGVAGTVGADQCVGRCC